MKSQWKIQLQPKLCFRKNFLDIFMNGSNSAVKFSVNTNTFLKKTKFEKSIRFIDNNTITLGACKKIKLFSRLSGFNLAVWSGNKFNIFHVNESMIGLFVGSFVFTKRFTKEIHKKQIQARHKRSFTKKK